MSDCVAAAGPSTPQQDDIYVAEEVKMAVELSLQRFRLSDQREMDFPSSFTATERAYIHRMAQSMGFISKSQGKGYRRFLTIWKRDGQDKALSTMPLRISQQSSFYIHSLLQKFPRKGAHPQPNTKSGASVPAQHEHSSDRFRPCGYLYDSIPLVPEKRKPSELDGFRRSLPVHECQEEIVQLIRANRVVLVVGETGSGKTTQIPQFLLDDCSMKAEACKILCTQPRCLAVIDLAERVSAERGESVGQTVGYHTRLENRSSSRTVLTFCTTDVLLRTMIAGDTSLKTVTHVIVDEVHERDGLTDLLLTKMWSMLRNAPSLRLILSSAALDVDLFCQYFGSCPVIRLKGRVFRVRELFLEDVLQLMDFNKTDMRKYKDETERKEKQRRPESVPGVPQDNSPLDGEDNAATKLEEKDSQQLEPWLVQEMDACIANIFFSNNQDPFEQMFNFIRNENVPVDYTDSMFGATPLMVAASQGLVAQIEQLLIMGADINIKASNGWTALDLAVNFQHTDAVDLLRSSIPLRDASGLGKLTEDQRGEEQELLSLYHRSFDDEPVDVDLIMDLLHHICSTTRDGAVLIFLPGYDEILTLRYRLLFDDKRFSSCPKRFQIFTLHSDMQTLDQRVLDTSPPGVRKIILSTEIAETSITIDDVEFVIDSGKVREKSFDALSHSSMFKTAWISKTSALQRRGRAGRCRPGVCFHLFSQIRFSNMLEFQVPQLLQMPLQGLCLRTKLLAPSSHSVADFLSKAPQPPPADAISNAMHRLMTTDAMTQDEDLTLLGCYLSDLSIEPHLGKMVLCSVVLKCLDPILTIACMLAYRDPFILPVQASQRRAALHSRKCFSSCSLSDHMALLRAFQAWQSARYNGCERSFCEKNFLSQATMEMILGMRTQLLKQLRATGFVRPRGGCDIRDLNQNSENWAVVKAALVAGMYPNFVHMDQEMSQPSMKKVYFHATSVLNQFRETTSPKSAEPFPTDWLIYDEMRRGKCVASVRCCSLVTSIAVAIFGGHAMSSSAPLREYAVQKRSSPLDDSDSGTEDVVEIRVDRWLAFQMDTQAAGLVSDLKLMWQDLFAKKIRCPSKSFTFREESILQILVSVLTEEEQTAGLQQPLGIGQRPRRMPPEEWPPAPVWSWKSSGSQQPTDGSHDRKPASSGLDQVRVHSGDEASPSTSMLCYDFWRSCSFALSELSLSSCPSTSGEELEPEAGRQLL